MTSERINNTLNCCIPLFLRCRTFLQAENGATTNIDFRDVIVADVANLERQAYAYQIPPAHIQHIKYAMAAFIDEMVMYSAWPQRIDWMGRTLQLQFFGEHIAGEGFFKRLSEIRQGGTQLIDVMEVYYWCLQLGFQGTYRLQQQENLVALQAGLRSQIEHERGRVDPQLSPFGLPPNNVVKQLSREVPFWVIGVVTVSVVFFIYLIYTALIDHQVKQAVQKVQQDFQLVAPYGLTPSTIQDKNDE